MKDKEDRLSPVARKLLNYARKKYSMNPQGAIEYLQSQSSEDLNLYDRQKIGREILARYKAIGEDSVDLDKIRGEYGLETSRDRQRFEEENRPGKYLEKYKQGPGKLKKAEENLVKGKKRINEYVENIFSMDNSATILDPGGSGIHDYLINPLLESGQSFESLGKFDKSQEAHSLAYEWNLFFRNMGRKMSIAQARDFFENHPKLKPSLEGIKEESKRSKGLERALNSASPAIVSVGILSGIFFLSTNITGNAIADFSTKTTSFLGAGLLIVGLVASFFWIKSRKK